MVGVVGGGEVDVVEAGADLVDEFVVGVACVVGEFGVDEVGESFGVDGLPGVVVVFVEGAVESVGAGD
ncbi:Uncharacterised protein [Dermatophilus congolensis]|uniref:Uncharacterized protein n=1 Tax=Dermatophilus congolensis TaxID=1863 RepID=A0AA46GZI4_9MICO|nr:Uncharacterised protein [Dermatophilus congolensis]